MLYTATLDYMATGEGRTLRLIAFHADDMDAAKAFMMERFGSYFGIGGDVFEGLPPEDHSPALFLLSEAARRFLSNDPLCHLEFDFQAHYNFS